LNKWNEGWTCLFNALDSIDKDNFNTKIYIRNQEHSIVEAINRQLTHYTYHIGQIVYIAKMIKEDKWKSLTIPKDKSADLNKDKFLRGKHGGHFSEES
jgi:hypothetical protein